MTDHFPSEPIMRAKNLCLLLVISFPYFITRLLTPRCASRGLMATLGAFCLLARSLAGVIALL